MRQVVLLAPLQSSRIDSGGPARLVSGTPPPA